MSYWRQLGKSRSGASLQWLVIDAGFRPVSYSCHVSLDTIASSVALFNQSSQAVCDFAAADLPHPAVFGSVSLKHQQSMCLLKSPSSVLWFLLNGSDVLPLLHWLLWRAKACLVKQTEKDNVFTYWTYCYSTRIIWKIGLKSLCNNAWLQDMEL